MSNSVKPDLMRDVAYRSLRRLLVLQQIPQGQRLREPFWSKQLGVNRTALREAFARLEAEGLIDKGESTGYFVPELTEQDLNEIRVVRLVLERSAIEQITASAELRESASQKLLKVCDELEKLVAAKYLLGASESDRRFHETLVDSAGNKRLSLLYHRAPLPLIHGPMQSESRWVEEQQLTVDEHRAIADAIGQGDCDTAVRRLVTHLNVRHLVPMLT